MILTGRRIQSEVEANRITVERFTPERLEPNSYGFRLAPKVLCYQTDRFDAYEPPAVDVYEMGPEGMVFYPDRFYLGATAEAMGSEHYAATLYACRSVSTLGVWIQFSAPLGHSGAVIPWTLEIKCAQPVRLYPGMVVGKIAFWAMVGERLDYDGKYSGSEGAVASRLGLERASSRDLVNL